jgi:hypothetical protein
MYVSHENQELSPIFRPDATYAGITLALTHNGNFSIIFPGKVRSYHIIMDSSFSFRYWLIFIHNREGVE